MLPRRAILRFSLTLAALYSLMVVPMMVSWPGARAAYAGLFRAAGDIVFTRFWLWSEGHVRFFDLHSADLADEIDRATPGALPEGFETMAATDELDTLMVIMNRQVPGTFGQLRISSRLAGYWPAAWLVALTLAKPMPWRRRGKALVGGLILVHAFIALRVSVTIAHAGYAADKAYALFDASALWRDILGRADTLLLTNPTVSFVVATFIWLVVGVSRAEWAALRETLLPEE